MKAGSSSSAMSNQRVFRILGYLLIFLMMACAILTFSNLIYNLAPHWHAGLIASIMLFIVIDRLYTYRQVKSLTFLSSEWAFAIIGQWLLIVLLTRFLLSYANGLEALQADLSLLARGYIAELFTLELVASLMFAFVFWILAGRFLEMLDQIGLDQILASQESPIQSETVPTHQRLVSLTFSIGIGLVILTALARLDYNTLTSNVAGLPPVRFNQFSGGEAGALLYFIFGLALLSLSRLMSLHTHWNRLRIPVSSRNLYRQWGMYSLLFLLLLGLVVSLLPAGDSLGFFSVLGMLFDFLIGALLFIGQVIIALLMLLISLPFILFGGRTPGIMPSAPPPMPVFPQTGPVTAPTNSELLALFRSILLWGGLAAILVLAFVQFVRQHGGIRAALRNARITNWLLLAWQWLYRNAEIAGGNVSRALAEGWQNMVARLEGKRLLPRPDWINLRSLDPRRQIYFFYLAMIRRGAEQGLTRQPAQTPAEYAAQLEKALPAAGEDIESITEAFIQARYSRQEVDSEKANVIKATWGRIRKALQEKLSEERGKNQ
jgi:hypothetical protein